MPYIFIRLDCLFETSVYIPNSNKLVLVLVAGPSLNADSILSFGLWEFKRQINTFLGSMELSL